MLIKKVRTMAAADDDGMSVTMCDCMYVKLRARSRERCRGRCACRVGVDV